MQQSNSDVKILIAEDSPTQALQLQRMLENQGYVVTHAANGRLALEAAQSSPPTLIISDVNMPEMDGYEFCRRVKSDSNLSDVPVILVTTMSDPHEVIRGLECGADNFILKPYDEKYLLGRVRFVLLNCEVRQTERVGVGVEIVFNEQRHFITADRLQILNLLISTYEAALQRNTELITAQTALRRVNSEIGETNQHLKREITVREQAEQALHASEVKLRDLNENLEHLVIERAGQLNASEERFRQITENVADLIALLDLEGRRVYNNPAYSELLGDPTMLIGSESIHEVHPDDQERIHQIFKETVRTGIGQRVEYRIVARDGSVHEIESRDTVVRDGTGRITNVLVVGRDITERKQSEQKLRLSEFSVERSSVATLWCGPDGKILHVNEAACALLGYTITELLQLKVLDLNPPKSESAWETHWQDFKERKRMSFESNFRCKDGRLFPTEVDINWVEFEGREYQFMFVRDITERKQIERQTLRSQRLDSIGTLAGGVAHDLNNALAPILMVTELLRMKYPDATQLIDTVKTSAQRGADMVRQLLTFAKGVEGARLSIQPVHLLKEVEKFIMNTFPKDIRLRCNFAKDLRTILGDATQLHQVLLNLCVNARDAMPNGGTLTLDAENTEIDATFASSVPEAKPGSYFVCSVADTGTGIAPEVMERIFDPFFTTKGPDKGTGLGLSTVAGIIKSHGGFIQVSSSPGQGSTFTFYLPADDSSSTPKESAKTESTFRGNGETILVVDDEATVRDIMSAVLMSLNFRVITAADGTEALIQAAEKHAELGAVITDLHMPHMDGLSLVRTLIHMLPEAGIIVASGRLEEREVNEFKEMRVNAILDKPFTQEKLVEALRTVFRNENV